MAKVQKIKIVRIFVLKILPLQRKPCKKLNKKLMSMNF